MTLLKQNIIRALVHIINKKRVTTKKCMNTNVLFCNTVVLVLSKMGRQDVFGSAHVPIQLTVLLIKIYDVNRYIRAFNLYP